MVYLSLANVSYVLVNLCLSIPFAVKNNFTGIKGKKEMVNKLYPYHIIKRLTHIEDLNETHVFEHFLFVKMVSL